MADLLTLGEVLIDLTQTGVSPAGIAQFAANPGGAPANVAVAASRLGAKVGFIGKVGADSFGVSLRRTLEENAVETAGLYETGDTPTTLAIVHVREDGERSFAFYRSPGADTLLTEAEAVQALQKETNGKILHFGSLSLTAEPSRSACLAAVHFAKERGALISYDPNYRASLWPDPETAVFWMKEPLALVDILKISDEELPLLTGTRDLEEGSLQLSRYGIPLVLITLGEAGVHYRFREASGTVPSAPVTVADTNGAGDTFLGALLSGLLEQDAAKEKEDSDDSAGCRSLLDLSEAELTGYLAYANRAAGKTCQRSGAIPAMPTREEMEHAAE